MYRHNQSFQSSFPRKVTFASLRHSSITKLYIERTIEGVRQIRRLSDSHAPLKIFRPAPPRIVAANVLRRGRDVAWLAQGRQDIRKPRVSGEVRWEKHDDREVRPGFGEYNFNGNCAVALHHSIRSGRFRC